MSTLWRYRPLFITSTFRDFQAERDHLRNVVFPALEERLQARRHNLEPIDLRWGVETTSEAEANAKEMLVLKVCLAEVERSRPFLIGLVGDRYGWVPTEERMVAAAREAGFEGEVANRSVTDLEIEFGVLTHPEQRQRSFFYFRDALPYDRMSADDAATYSELHGPRGEEGQALVEGLKNRIESALPNRVRRYRARWDEDAAAVTGLEEWGRCVLEDLWNELDLETAQYAAHSPSWQDQERFLLDQFVEDRAQDFVGREALIDELVRFAAEDGKAKDWSVCLSAAPGAGKSALFAKLKRELDDASVFVLAHAAGISPRAGDVEGMLLRWIEELASELGIPNPLPDEHSGAPPEPTGRREEVAEDNKVTSEVIEQTFSRMLHQVSATRRVVLLVDALDQFRHSPWSLHMTWLPRIWPENAKFIATGIPGLQTEALEDFEGVRTIPVGSLSNQEAKAIIGSICGRYRRTLAPDVVAIIAEKETADGGLAAGNPLWLTLAVEELNLLDADDFSRANREFPGTPEEKLHQLLMDTAAQLPPTVADLFGRLIARAEQVNGREWARGFVELIALSRFGWREQDFEQLLPAITNETWDELRFATLRRTLRAQVVARGGQGQWDFAHEQLRTAVLTQMLPTESDRREQHQRLADYLLSLPEEDPVHRSETMVHVIGAERWERAASYYGARLSTPELDGATDALVAWVSERGTEAWERLASLHLETTNDDTVTNLCRHFSFALNDALNNKASLDRRIFVCRATLEAARGLAARHLEDRRRRRALKVACDTLGELFYEQGSLIEATAIFEEAMRNLDPGGDDVYLRDPLVTIERIGAVHESQGNLAESLTAYTDMLMRARSIAASLPGDLSAVDDVVHAQLHISTVQMRLGRLEQALEAATDAAELHEQQPRDREDPPERRRDRALAYQQVGAVKQGRGDLTAAFSSYRVGLGIAEKLVEQDPSSGQWRQILANLHMYIGSTLETQGELNRALASYRAGLDIAEKLVEQDPSNGQWRQILANLHMYIGTTLQTQAELNRALDSFRAGLEISEKLAELDPSNGQWRQTVASLHMYIGSTLQTQGELNRALDSYRAGLQISEKLVEFDPSNGQWRQTEASLHLYNGSTLQTQGELNSALDSYRAGLGISEELVALDPSNGQWRQTLANLHMYIGATLQAQGELNRALTSFHAGLGISEKLVELDPSNEQWWQVVANLHLYIGATLQTQGELDRALASYRAGLEISEKLVDLDLSNGQWRQIVANLHTYTGATLQTQGELYHALASYRAGLGIWEALVALDPSNGQWRQNIANLHMYIGATLEARGEPRPAFDAYMAGLEESQHLTRQRPDNAVSRRNVWVACFHLAHILEELRENGAQEYWKRGAETLAGMQNAGMRLSDEEVQFLETMRQKADM